MNAAQLRCSFLQQLQGQPGEYFLRLLLFGPKEEVFDVWKVVEGSCSLP